MDAQHKVVGVGYPKSGTKTLGACFEILGIEPLIELHRPAARRVVKGDPALALTVAEQYRSFEDGPWHEIFDAMDTRFPGSKFVLTTRINPRTHAVSMWHHQVKKGRRSGFPTKEFLEDAQSRVRRHEARVRGYFRGRSADLLVVCWEAGDGWPELCEFLDAPVPEVEFPHKNRGRYARPPSLRERAQRRIRA